MEIRQNRDYELVIEYLMNHLNDYNVTQIKYILSNYRMLESNSVRYIPSELREIYDIVNILLPEENMYEGFVKLLKKEHDIEGKNIVEVAGGVIPTISMRIKTKAGSVTVYDPKIGKSIRDTDKLKLVRQKFDGKTPLPQQTDLLIGFMPCGATEKIIENACNNNVDFMIGLCEGGEHEYSYFEDSMEWQNYILDFAQRKIENNNMGELKQASLKKYGDPYPVIYNKRR